MMVNNEKSLKETKEVLKKATNNVEETSKDHAIGNVTQYNATFLQNMHSSIIADEASRDTATDAMEAKIIDAHMKLLEDHSISIEKREQILKDAYARVDKRRDYDNKNKRERTKRWNMALWKATFAVLGTAALKYAPNIVSAYYRNRRI